MSDTPAPFPDAPRIVGTETKLSGAADRIERELAFGERLVIVVDVSVASLRLKASGDGPRLVRDLHALDIYELDGDRGRDVLATLRAERRTMDDTAAGRAPLPGLEGPELTDPDGKGALATPAELADEGHDLTEPWPGYDGQGVAEVLDAVESTIEAAGPGSVGAVTLIDRVEAYERGPGKSRSGVLNGLEKLRPTPPPTPGAEPALPGEEDDTPVIVDEEDDLKLDDDDAPPTAFTP